MRSFLLALFTVTGFYSFAQRACESFEYKQKQLLLDPTLLSRVEAIESFTQGKLNNIGSELPGTAAGSIQSGISLITIPVVVHVIYNSEVHNLSDEQVLSQIDALNRDFRKLNSDTSRTPEKFKPFATDTYIQFKLATVDPRGNATTGIIRKKTSIQLFGLDDRIKQSAIGGDDGWDADSYLNIWVGNLAGGMIGYSSVMGGPKNFDGVVIRSAAFGTTGSASPPFHLGRTATHEVGHWLGLQHIWGDVYCGNDQVDDTPPQQSPSRGCPSGNVQSCTNTGNMYMNFMDFTNDECTNMFTLGQRERMRVAFKSGGARHKLLSSKGASGEAVAIVPKPEEKEVPVILHYDVFPNPFSSTLQIRSQNNKGTTSAVYVYNHLGQMVKQLFIRQESSSIDLSELKQGIYFLKLGEERKTIKVVKK